uniref:Uncharacterized protein n=1 Tax=Pseudo-nitzschia australis TaxID=44445 RepID=A0A7S4AJP6_9STRA|mmetsp:Transcript_1713/g.3235  ORF Transcript_1713/g.3235 Transcript_1713/m.3235 type:complete len:408 (-) Transcript_1713:926-2149(-)
MSTITQTSMPMPMQMQMPVIIVPKELDILPPRPVLFPCLPSSEDFGFGFRFQFQFCGPATEGGGKSRDQNRTKSKINDSIYDSISINTNTSSNRTNASNNNNERRRFFSLDHQDHLEKKLASLETGDRNNGGSNNSTDRSCSTPVTLPTSPSELSVESGSGTEHVHESKALWLTAAAAASTTTDSTTATTFAAPAVTTTAAPMVGIITDRNGINDSRHVVHLQPKSLSIYVYTEMSSLSLLPSLSSLLSSLPFAGAAKQKQKPSSLPPARLPLSPREKEDNDNEYNDVGGDDHDDDSFVSIPDMAYLPGDIDIGRQQQQQRATVSKPILHEAIHKQPPKQQQQQQQKTATTTKFTTLADVITEVLRVILYIVALKNSLLGGPKHGNHNHYHHHYSNSHRYEAKLVSK